MRLNTATQLLLSCAAAFLGPGVVEATPPDSWVLEKSFGSADPSADLPISVPVGIAIAVGADGTVFTHGNLDGRVFRFNANGVLQPQLIDLTQIIRSLAVQGSHLFIGDGNGVVHKYNLISNQFVSFDPVTAYAADAKILLAATPTELFVSDGRDVHRYTQFDQQYVGSWGVVPELGDFVRAKGLTTLRGGNVLVYLATLGSLAEFSPDGDYIRGVTFDFGTQGASSPMCITAHGGRAFMGADSSDKRSHLIDRFGRLLPDPMVDVGLGCGTFGPDGALYVYTATAVLQRQVLKFRAAYRTADVLAGAGYPPIAEVITVQPRPGATVTDIDYRIHDVDSPSVTTASLAFVDGDISIASARRVTSLVEGTGAQLGPGTPTDSNRRFSWDAAADLAGGSAVSARIAVYANDGRGIVDIHYITLPANIPTSGDPTLLISDTPITDADMLNAWFWLIARNDPQLALSNGNLVKVGGADNGTVFASGTTTTAAGRAHLFARLNVREATPAEITRAKTGTTPGVQQYEPIKRVGTRPVKINEVGFDTGATEGYWVVPL